MKGAKVVRTDLDLATHQRLKRLADRRTLPLSAVVREAVISYLRTEEGELTNDPIFGFVGRLGLRSRNRSERKDWRS